MCILFCFTLYIHVPSRERSHIPFQGTVSDSQAVRYVNVSSLEGIYVCVFYVVCRVSLLFVVSIWFSICDDRMFSSLEGINAQCHTGETVLMLALKDGQVWMASVPLIPGVWRVPGCLEMYGQCK